MINALLGPFDMINGIYDINEMPDRRKGSRNAINSTVAGENARAMIMFSGLVVLPDAPEEYNKKPDMFEFLREMPATWDDTRILHSSLPNYITTARRSGEAWFVCSATNESARTLDVSLDFLDAGVTYDVTYYEDDHDGANPTHYKNNRETYRVRSGTATCADTVSAVMVAGGGHCMWMRPTGESDDGCGPPSAATAVDATCSGDLCQALTGVPVRFEDASTGKVQSRRWDFGDGGSSAAATVEHAWSAPGFYEVTLWVSDGEVESTATRTFLVEASNPAGTCEADGETLCLRDSRYMVRVEWWTAAGQGGFADVVHAGTNDSGLFRFFSRDNWEVLVKLLDGCARNGHIWAYGASATDLGYSIRITDTVTQVSKAYGNDEPGMPVPAITDPTAFPEACRR